MISRISLLTRTDQKFLSFALSSLWKLIPAPDGSIWRSMAVVFTAFCSSPVRRARLSVKVSEMRKFIGLLALRLKHWHCPDHELIEEWNRKSKVAVRRTEDHSLFDKLGSHRAKARDLNSQ